MTLPDIDSEWSDAEHPLATVRVIRAFYDRGGDVVDVVALTDQNGFPFASRDAADTRKTQYAGGAFRSCFRAKWIPTVGDRVIIVHPPHPFHCRAGVLVSAGQESTASPWVQVDIDTDNSGAPGARTTVALAKLRPENWDR